MFGWRYSNTATEAQQEQPARSQLQGSVRRRMRSPSPSVPSSRMSQTASTMGGKDTTGLRYTNKAYNRQPSPVNNLQHPLEGRRIQKEIETKGNDSEFCEEKAQPRPNPRQPPVNRRRSDVFKQNPVETEVQDQEQRLRSSYQKPRPKTTGQVKVGRGDVEPPTVEGKMFSAVKDVLSRAVLENGKIDERNIKSVLQAMRSRLVLTTGGDDDDGLSTNIGVEKKQSRTEVSVNTSNSNMSVMGHKPLSGIIRREISSARLQRPYRKMYSRTELPTIKKEQTKKVVIDEDPETLVYIDLPDPDYSNFNSVLRKNEERQREIQNRESSYGVSMSRSQVPVEKCSRKESTLINAKQGGDHHTTQQDKSSGFWKAEEETKLQNYIEFLVRNMGDQLSGKCPLQNETEMKTDSTVCRSFCVCKVCVCNNETSKASRPPLEPQPSESRVKDGKPAEKSVKGRPSSISSVGSRLRQQRVAHKESGTDEHFKVLKRNQNFQPESAMTLSPSQTHRAKDFVPQMAFTGEEDLAEDMYLQRRIKKPLLRDVQRSNI